ncbi:cytochrome b [Polymorphum gilvum]|uniref:Cytochrome B561 n=1 Tax=Polymorphum gilvum (strain LMG 25793 / CGMCC 1.9160 / SL003B-26A1) TaxID=991905 RepID=F2J5X2_POLGS|nr:cytochrome b [Polymorphum gilvum]ADZ71226.1 Cytochrome B561 [Polymorphum gilvum SL003B-26A1]
MLRNSPSGYGRVAIAFHWTMALLIVAMLALGMVMHRMPPTDPATFALYQWHKSFGFVALGLAVLRMLWRATNPVPRLPEGMAGWERAAAHAGHLALYGLMLAIPLTGWLMVSASPWAIPTVLFGAVPVPHLPVPEALGSKAEAETLFKDLHELFAWLLILLLVAHVGAALKHHFIARDTTLRRMVSTEPARSA